MMENVKGFVMANWKGIVAAAVVLFIVWRVRESFEGVGK